MRPCALAPSPYHRASKRAPSCACAAGACGIAVRPSSYVCRKRVRWRAPSGARPLQRRCFAYGPRRAAPRPIPPSLRPSRCGWLFFAADLAVWHWSIIYTSVASATLLANLAPIFVTLASWFFFRKRVTAPLPRRDDECGSAGMFVLVGPNFAAGGTRLAGDALGALTAVFYAGYMLAIKTARDAGISDPATHGLEYQHDGGRVTPRALFSPQPLLPQSPARVGRSWRRSPSYLRCSVRVSLPSGSRISPRRSRA